MKVFLGGTCNDSQWRDQLVPLLKCDYFNPVVPDWTPECYEEELRQRQTCDYVLYVITPRMTGVYSIAEVVDDSNKRPEKTLFCVLPYDYTLEKEQRIGINVSAIMFDTGQMKSLEAVKKMVANNGGKVFATLEDVAAYLNQGYE